MGRHFNILQFIDRLCMKFFPFSPFLFAQTGGGGERGQIEKSRLLGFSFSLPRSNTSWPTLSLGTFQQTEEEEEAMHFWFPTEEEEEEAQTNNFPHNFRGRPPPTLRRRKWSFFTVGEMAISSAIFSFSSLVKQCLYRAIIFFHVHVSTVQLFLKKYIILFCLRFFRRSDGGEDDDIEEKSSQAKHIFLSKINLYAAEYIHE